LLHPGHAFPASSDRIEMDEKAMVLPEIRRKKRIVLFIIGIFFLVEGSAICGEGEDKEFFKLREKYVMEWRKERDHFFETHQRSPLTPSEKRHFKGLDYYPFDPKYIFVGTIERYHFHINNPKYYATFLTNKGVNKRYIRYGKFHFSLDGKQDTIEVYKSILSDMLFIPFKDLTNGKETYEGGRYIDAEVLPGYKMMLDFNMAYYPSCAYNDKFNCVLPPKENMLEVAIRAGERNAKAIGDQSLKRNTHPGVIGKSDAALFITNLPVGRDFGFIPLPEGCGDQ
jgi:uncharacterized protein (DUF1684 family)